MKRSHSVTPKELDTHIHMPLTGLGRVNFLIPSIRMKSPNPQTSDGMCNYALT